MDDLIPMTANERRLTDRIDEQTERIKQLNSENVELRDDNRELRVENRELHARVEELENAPTPMLEETNPVELEAQMFRALRAMAYDEFTRKDLGMGVIAFDYLLREVKV